MKALLRQGNISVEELVEQVGTSAPASAATLRGSKSETYPPYSWWSDPCGAMLYEPFRHDTSFAARELASPTKSAVSAVAASELISERRPSALLLAPPRTQVGRSYATPGHPRHHQCSEHRDGALQPATHSYNHHRRRPSLEWTFAMAGPAVSPSSTILLR